MGSVPPGKAGDVIGRELTAMCNPGIVLVPSPCVCTAGTLLISITMSLPAEIRWYKLKCLALM